MQIMNTAKIERPQTKVSFSFNYTALIYNSVLNLRTLISLNAPAAIVIELTFFLTVYPETDEGRVIVIFEDAEL